MSEEPDISAVPVYDDFFHKHESYERYHIHVVGLASSSSSSSTAESHALQVRRGWFGVPRIVDAIADPFVTVETVGSDTGSTDYFPIGKYQFPVLTNCQTPLWDAKCVLIGKKETTEGLRFALKDDNDHTEDQVLFDFTLHRKDLPPISSLKDSVWTHFSHTPKDASPEYANVTFEFHIMVTDGAERIVSQEQTIAICDSLADRYSYTEEILPDKTACDEDNALLQCWQRPNNAKAVLWILGRNDCFMHPHVARKLFLDHGYDLYVLNYKMNGHCRKQGWVADPHYNSHNKQGTFDVYINDITQALQKIADHQTYETFVGYAHSTGGPVLLNYLMEKGDAAFDAFLFNSPFLDWGFVGGDMIEFVLENTGILAKLGAMENNTKVGAAETPEALKDTPVEYLNQSIVYSDWSARLWSLYYFEFGTRPLYKVPMTVGFAQGVTAVHEKMARWRASKRAITAKPFLCITSRGDDVLKSPETLSRADWIGPGRWEIELNDNGHDVFLSYDEADTNMAIDMCLAWLKNRRLV